ncbi:MAG: UbiD family decarboxylase [Candidatus Bathyarchaeia archaeon]
MSNLREFIKKLDEEGKLHKVKNEVSIKFQVAQIIKKFDGEAVLFEKVKGFPNKIVSGVCSSRDKICLALKVSKEDLHKKILDSLNSPEKPLIVNDAPVKDVSEKPKLSRIPILKHYEKDGGPYITSAIVTAKDSEENENVSIHRLMVLNENHVAIRIVPRHLYQICREAEKKGMEEIDVAIAIGLHPAVLLAAASPAPYGINEYWIANSFMNGELTLTSLENGLHIPAEAEAAFEGKLLLKKEVDEGPFVDLTGTYDIVRRQPVIKLTKFIHREDYLYQALLPGGSEHKILMGLPYEAKIYGAVKNVIPKVKDVFLTSGGCGWFSVRISIEKQTEGDGKTALMAAFGAHPSLKLAAVFDSDINIFDPEEVEWALATRFQPDKGVLIIKNARGSTLDPSADQELALTSKLGIDATRTLLKPKEKFEKAKIP